MEAHTFAGPALFTDDLSDALKVLRHALVSGRNVVEGVGDFAYQASPGTRQAHRKIAVLHALQGGEDSAQVCGVTLGATVAIAVLSALPFRLGRHIRGRRITFCCFHLNLQPRMFKPQSRRRTSSSRALTCYGPLRIEMGRGIGSYTLVLTVARQDLRLCSNATGKTAPIEYREPCRCWKCQRNLRAIL